MTPITCPNPACRAITNFPDGFDTFQRGSDEFCPKCDTPLFWVPTRHALASLAPGSDNARRRLPGAGPTGQAALGSRPCPVCHERNTLKAVYCYRCGAELDPKVAPPPPPPPAPPEPTPVIVYVEPEPEPEPDWRWLIVSVLTILITVGLATWLG